MNLGDENTEHGKSQLVRLLDVFFIGPMMIWGGRKAGGAGGTVLAALGVATIFYNARNYYRIARLERTRASALGATSTRPLGRVRGSRRDEVHR